MSLLSSARTVPSKLTGPVPLTTAGGLAGHGQNTDRKTLALDVEGVLDAPKGGSPFGEVSISKTTFDSSFANHDNEMDAAEHRRRCQRRQHGSARKEPRLILITVDTRDEFKDPQLGDLTTTRNTLYLFLSVVVSLFGVINTLRPLGLRADA